MRIFLITFLLIFYAHSEEITLLLGTHDEAGSEGLYIIKFDSKNLKLSKPELVEKAPGTTVVRTTGNGRFYSAGGNENGGVLKSFEHLIKSSEIDSFPKQPCYISLDKSGRFLFTANIRGDSISCFRLDSNGALKTKVQDLVIKPIGKAFRPHSVIPSPDNKFLFVADIAGRRICRIAFNSTSGQMNYEGDITSNNFVGPRHIIFDEGGKYFYLMNQMGGAVTVFEYSPTGNLKEVQHVSSLPADFIGKNHSADLRIHPTGKFLYCSNRGPDSLTLFKRDLLTGKLAFVETVSSGGNAPWSFVICRQGKFLFCTNKMSNNVVVFEIDKVDGRLTRTAVEMKVQAPVSIEILSGNR